MEKLKLALCGGMGHVEKFGKLINSYEESCIVAVWDNDPERGRGVADRLGCAFEADYDRLLSEYGLDGVAIVAENCYHKDMIIKAAEKGKHIFVEKPLCVDPADAREVQRVIHRTGVKFYMTDPFVHASTVYVKKLIADGALGKVTGARFRHGTSTALEPQKDCPIYEKERALGGIMADVGGHMIHIAHYLFGKPEALSAVLSCHSEAAKRSGIEENAVVVMKYPDDKLVTLESSWVSGGDTNASEVFGTDGWVRVTRSGKQEGDDIVVYQRGREAAVTIPDSAMPEKPARHVRYWVEMMANDLPNDIVGVDDRSNSGVSIDNAVEFVDIIDAVYRSADRGMVTL